MGTCFVMQPFDGSTFDRRYEEIFKPAIEAAKLDPYRVDQDPKASIPIDEIERGIREARVCLAEITNDNPNVWFELGYAIACGKEVVLICSDERQAKFPFDVQHRSIIRYSQKSPSDFSKLQSQITERLEAYLAKSEKIGQAAEISKLAKIDGMEAHEIVALAALAENLDHPDDNASTYQIKRDMEAAGFTKVAATIALKSLADKRLVEFDRHQDPENGDSYNGYSLTSAGWNWILNNQRQFALRAENVDADVPF